MKHSEQWDDSALIRSWDDALEEYKKYHSIHARGEKVEDVIQAVEAAEALEDGEVHVNGGFNHDEDTEMASEAQVSAQEQQIGQWEQHVSTVPTGARNEGEAPTLQAAAAVPSLASLPHSVLAPGQDEGFKNLLMSWYYAGYYTGLYEGQQRALQGDESLTEPAKPGGRPG